MGWKPIMREGYLINDSEFQVFFYFKKKTPIMIFNN